MVSSCEGAGVQTLDLLIISQAVKNITTMVYMYCVPFHLSQCVGNGVEF